MVMVTILYDNMFFYANDTLQYIICCGFLCFFQGRKPEARDSQAAPRCSAQRPAVAGCRASKRAGGPFGLGGAGIAALWQFSAKTFVRLALSLWIALRG